MDSVLGTFRVFVCSTFTDLQAERDVLHERVFPRLKRLCAEKGCRFQPIDLRWGVSEEASADQKTLHICTEEIKRCISVTPRPNFIVLLGERYGWRPLPTAILSDDFDRMLGAIEGASDRDLVRRWYVRDNNAVPSQYMLLGRLGAAGKGSRIGEKHVPTQTSDHWKDTEERLRHVLLAAARTSKRSSAVLESFSRSATEHEILHGILENPTGRESVFCFLREIAPESAKQFPFQEEREECRFRLDRLKRQFLPAHVPHENIFAYTDVCWESDRPDENYLSKMCEDVFRALEKSILREIEQLGVVDEADQEMRAHRSLEVEAAKPNKFVGRQRTREALQRYVRNPGNAPLLLSGDSGSGKTSLMAYTANHFRKELRDTIVVARFIGTTSESLTSRALLESICGELSGCGGIPLPVVRSYEALIENLRSQLEACAGSQMLVLLLDSLDALISMGTSATYEWLPRPLPDHVALVISYTDRAVGQLIDHSYPNAHRLSLPPMSRREAGEVLENWLRDSQRALRASQREHVMERFASVGTPLYLRLAFERAKTWRHDHEPDLEPTIEGVLGRFFEQLERPAQHGAALVKHAIGDLLAARYGLAEDEIIQILSSKEEVLSDIRERAPESPPFDSLPYVLWSRLQYDLYPYLSRRVVLNTSTLYFRNQLVEDLAVSRYFSDKEDQARCHEELSKYFRSQSDPDNDDGWNGRNPRGFSELPYHLYRAALLTNDTSPLYALGSDRLYRERQFLCLEALSPLREFLQYCLVLATSRTDPIHSFRFAWERSRLNHIIAKSFLWQLPSVAKANADFARELASTISTPLHRFLGLTVVAWTLAEHPEHIPEARGILHELGTWEHAEVTPGHVPYIVWLVHVLLALGIKEGLLLLRAVPDCPARTAVILAWRDGPPNKQIIADTLQQSPALHAAPQDSEWFGRGQGLVRSLKESFALNPARAEERMVRLFGESRIGEAYAFLAAHFLSTTRPEEMTPQVMNRGLFLSQARSTQMLLRSYIALMESLFAVGARTLAVEYRDRSRTAIGVSTHFFKSDESRRRMLVHWSRLMRRYSRWQVLVDPSVQRMEVVARATAESLLDEDPESAVWWIEKAVHAIETDLTAESRGFLEAALRVIDSLNDTSLRDGMLLAIASLARLVSAEALGGLALAKISEGVPSLEVLFKQGRREDANLQEPRIALFDLAMSGGPVVLSAVALALRLDEKEPTLYDLLYHVADHDGNDEDVDAINAQLIRLSTPDQTTLRGLATELARIDRRLGVASGMGAYYFLWPWLFLCSMGLLWMGIGAADRQLLYEATVVVCVGLFGGLADLYVWKRTRMWQRLELSRLAFAEVGTYWSLWLGLFLMCESHSQWNVNGDMVCGMLVAFGVSAMVLALMVFLAYHSILRSYHSILRSQTKNRYQLAGIALVSATALAFAGPAIRESMPLDLLKGFWLCGAFMLAVGLNLLVKHIPVRKHYREAGIDLSSAGEHETLPGLPSPVTGFTEPSARRVREILLVAQQSLFKSRLAKADFLYTDALEHPDFSKLDLEDQCTAFNNRGTSRRRLGNIQGAIDDFHCAIARNPNTPSPFLNLGLAYAQNMGDFAAAIPFLREAILHDPFNPEVYSTLGICHMKLREFGDAEQALEMALALEPAHADALSNFGTLLTNQGRLAEARDYFRRAFEANERDHELRYNYAAIIAALGDEEKAIRLLRKDPRALRRYLSREHGPRHRNP